MPKLKAWISAARLRTLPLSLSGIIVGTALANHYGAKDSLIFLFALLTTIGFQITSNFANDYGDGVKGTDNENRIGPQRAYQSGLLSRKALKRGILLASILSFLLSLVTLWLAFGMEHWDYLLIFIGLGLFSIWAAIRYTVGENAYGYQGLGDLFVFCFFGLLSVLGGMFLYTKSLSLAAILPAVSIGFLCAAVLNLNNLRDYESDRLAGKNTLVVKLGLVAGKRYHYFLVLGALVCFSLFVLSEYKDKTDFLCLLAFLPLLLHLKAVIKIKNPVSFDPELKKVALSTFLLALLFYIVFNNFL